MARARIAVVVGTRPEVIKMAPVVFALQKHATLEPLLISTGQHREMLDQSLKTFGLAPEIDLKVMNPSQTLAGLTERVLSGMTETLRREKPAAVLVQGDTTTVLATALAAFYERIPVGHVEAGLRTGNLDSPWPEEMNRRLADPISRWCFAPTTFSRDNLLRENIPASRVFVTGNTVIDSLLWIRSRAAQSSEDIRARAMRCGCSGAIAGSISGSTGKRRMVLVTGHRRESFGAGFERICHAIRDIVDRYPDVVVVYPVHLNPNVREPVGRLLGAHERISLIEPLGYEDFVAFMDASHVILSDSGGVQEEAPSLGKPVLVMRDTTERPEGVEAGTSRLVGTEPAQILREISLLLDSAEEYRLRSTLKNPYGDGNAATRVVETVASELPLPPS